MKQIFDSKPKYWARITERQQRRKRKTTVWTTNFKKYKRWRSKRDKGRVYVHVHFTSKAHKEVFKGSDQPFGRMAIMMPSNVLRDASGQIVVPKLPWPIV